MIHFRATMRGVVLTVCATVLGRRGDESMRSATTAVAAFSAVVLPSCRTSVGSGLLKTRQFQILSQGPVSCPHRNSRRCGYWSPGPAAPSLYESRPLFSTADPEDGFSPAADSNNDVASKDGSVDSKTIWQRVRAYFAPKKEDNLPFRQRLAKMGLAAVLSYGWVSNMSYSVTVSIAWYIFSKQVRFVSLHCVRIEPRCYACYVLVRTTYGSHRPLVLRCCCARFSPHPARN
jgi:hypothetical protein